MIVAVFITSVTLLAAAPNDAVVVSFWAVQATHEGQNPKHFDPGLEAIQGAVADLPFDTYRKVQAAEKKLAFGSENRLALDARYTLVLKPIAKEPDGRIRMDIRVEMAPQNPQDKPVTALSTRMALSPGKQTKLGGFKLDRGELVIVLSARS